MELFKRNSQINEPISAPSIPEVLINIPGEVVGYFATSEYGVSMRILKTDSPVVTDNGEVIFPKDSLVGSVSIRPALMTAEQIQNNQARGHALLCSIYGLRDCLAAVKVSHQSSDYEVQPPDFLLARTHKRMMRLGSRIGFKVIDEDIITVEDRPFTTYRVTGVRQTVEEGIDRFLKSIPEDVRSRIVEDAKDSFPEFWISQKKGVEVGPIMGVNIEEWSRRIAEQIDSIAQEEPSVSRTSTVLRAIMLSQSALYLAGSGYKVYDGDYGTAACFGALGLSGIAYDQYLSRRFR